MSIDINNQKSILCYGDSNTWGFIAEKANYENMHIERYPRSVRWPGKLQELLGEKYYVIEEGLNGRTTNLDTPIPPDRNGKTYLGPCLYTHAPIDLVILLLGGNDLKSYFSRDSEEIANGLGDLIDLIQSTNYGKDINTKPDILVVSQPIPLPKCEEYVDEEGTYVFEGSMNRANILVDKYAQLSKEKSCYFIDVTSEVKPGEFDGMHLDENGHANLANKIAYKIDKIFSGKLLR